MARIRIMRQLQLGADAQGMEQGFAPLLLNGRCCEGAHLPCLVPRSDRGDPNKSPRVLLGLLCMWLSFYCTTRLRKLHDQSRALLRPREEFVDTQPKTHRINRL